MLLLGVILPETLFPFLVQSGASFGNGLGRLIGSPAFPVTPTFPLLGPLGAIPLPSKWIIRFGEPLAMERFTSDAARDELLISRLNEELRSRIQSMLNEGVRSRPSVWE